MKLILPYCLFAVIAITANICTQDILTYFYHGRFSLMVSILLGTIVGLVIKYILDKKYIFKYQTVSASHNSQTFALYAAMGLFTTLFFWGFEFSFDYIFKSKSMRYLGATIGLVIGYYLKYQLDKRYVFS